MALTRKALKAMGLTDEQVDSIVEMHVETTDALKEQRDAFKADAEKLLSDCFDEDKCVLSVIK